MQIPLLNPVEFPSAKAPVGSSTKQENGDSADSFSRALTTATSDADVRENAASATPKTESPDQIGADHADGDVQVAALESDSQPAKNDSSAPADGVNVPADVQPENNTELDVVVGPIVPAQLAAHDVPIAANAAHVQPDSRASSTAETDTRPTPTVKIAEGASSGAGDQSTALRSSAPNSGDSAEASSQTESIAAAGTPRGESSPDRPTASREQSGNATETQARPNTLSQRDGQSATDTGKRDSSSPRDTHISKSPSLPQIAGDDETTPAMSRANQVNLAVHAMASANLADDASSLTASSTASLSSSVLGVEASGRADTNPAPQIAPLTRAVGGADSTQPETRPTENAFRIVRGMQTMLNTRGGAMSMRLDPPELGTMRIVMSVHNGSVSATFEVQSAAAMNALNQSMTALRQSLEHQGLLVERLHVHTAPQAQNESNLNHDRSAEDQDRSRFADAGQGESRGRQDDPSSGDRTSRKSTGEAVFTLTPDQ